MSTIFIIHGSEDDATCHWYPWLKSELELLGHTVIAPSFPCEDEYVLSRWFDTLAPYMKYIDESAIFIGHSRGCAFVWRVLEKIEKPIFAAFFVAGFTRYLWYPKPSGKLDSFYETPFDWEKIRSIVKHIKTYQSTNDHYVPMEMGQEVADALGVNMTIVENVGHFSKRTGFMKFPLLLEDVKEVLK
mgnify:CR=1 FL=1